MPIAASRHTSQGFSADSRASPCAVPSRASEFAHVDIIIGLTILAYRYEGLRLVDFESDVVGLLRTEFEKEVGPFHLRKSAQLYVEWVAQAGGVIKGSPAAADGSVDEELVVVPLWLLKQSNDEQMGKLFRLLRKLPSTIHHYLENVIFPTFMMQQGLKLSASGQELGGAMLFDKRVGFSGTPSDLLPLELGRCGYERGSDGKMVYVLTDPEIVGVQRAPDDWNVGSLIHTIATSEPHFNALIDTGALITGCAGRSRSHGLWVHPCPQFLVPIIAQSSQDQDPPLQHEQPRGCRGAAEQ